MDACRTTCFIPVRDYDLAATLSCGQAFRWTEHHGAWEGVVGTRWLRLRVRDGGMEAETATAVEDWSWLTHHLQSEVDLAAVLGTFPDDAAMRSSVIACRGLRLLRQEPWECLASFLLSSTKQIVQIRQIIGLLCARFGLPVAALYLSSSCRFATIARCFAPRSIASRTPLSTRMAVTVPARGAGI